MVEQGSEFAQTEQEFQSTWTWGVPTAMMHFCLQDPDHMTLAESEALQRRKAADRPQPACIGAMTAEGSCKPSRRAQGNELMQLMARRRTVRSAGKPTITCSSSRTACCRAGHHRLDAKRVGTLPLGMTPSGGARNPYEAYVYALTSKGWRRASTTIPPTITISGGSRPTACRSCRSWSAARTGPTRCRA